MCVWGGGVPWAALGSAGERSLVSPGPTHPDPLGQWDAIFGWSAHSVPSPLGKRVLNLEATPGEQF